MIRILISILFTSVLSSPPSTETETELSRTHHKQKRFNFPGGSSSMMGGGGPFHGGGSSMGPMGGSLSHGPMSAPSMSAGSGIQGPHPPGGGMGMAMGGPQSPGHASTFNPTKCLRQVRCPQWCLMVDSYGCHLCPCGPGGGMMAVPGGSFMSGMPSMGGAAFSHVSQGTKPKTDCIGVELCKSTCQGHHTLGPVGADGCPSCRCNSVAVGASNGGSGYVPGGSNNGMSGGSIGGAGSGSSVGFGGGSGAAGGSSGGSGGFTPFKFTGSGGGGGGMVTGSRPSVAGTTGTSTQTAYVVAPVKECRTEAICKETCGSNFQIGGTGNDGCGTCICLKPSVTYTQGITQVVQPEVQQVVTLTCPSLTCNYGCSVGYKCGEDGCPTCDCALPSGYATHEVVIQHRVNCVTTFNCPTSCEIGYTCGTDGCPTCECLKGYVQTQTTNECIDCEYIDFLTPTPESVTYVQTVPKQTETVYVTGGNECHDCDVKPQMVSYVRPRPQTQTVYVTNTNECHDCEPVKPQMVSYVRPRPKPRPQTQTVYVTGTQTACNGCEKPQTYYVQKPAPETVYVEKLVPEVEKSVPIYVDRQHPQKQTVVVTQTQTHSECHYSNTCGSSHYVSGSTSGSSGGVIMNVLTGGSSHTSGGSSYSAVSGGGSSYSATGSGGSSSYVGGRGGGTPYGISGGSAVYTNGRVIGVSGTGSAYCPPMRHDCHPACIKYDDPHCRRCLC